VVSPRLSTISCVVVAVVALSACVLSGQQPKRLEPAPAPLLPVEQAWTITLPSPPSAGGVLDRLRAYIPLESEQVLAVDRESGDAMWTADVESAWPPVAADGAVFVAASDEIHALDAATGGRRWRTPVERPVMAPMGFAGGRLIVAMAPDDVMAFAAEDGEMAWRRSLGGTAGPASMVVGPEAVYVTLDGARVVALAVSDGRILWQRKLDGALTAPAVAGNRVVVASSTAFYGLDARSGDVEWRWHAAGDGVGAAGDKDRIFLVSLDNTVKAVNRGNGHQRWRKTITRPLFAPYAFGGVVVVVGVSPTLSTFSAKDGLPISTYEAPAQLQGPPLIDRGLTPFAVSIVVIMRDGTAVGLRPTGMMFRELPVVPLTAVPGRVLTREPRPDALPLP
jgi:outer membrane protein assembly factor BamB